jgi:2-polyprenyl-3-methyl-5-hydroxy-6-metoxy-1,4-benzoquinol methylase
MAPSPRFWNKIAEKYAASPVADEASYRRKLETTRRYFGTGAQLFEFGCGTGSTALSHAPHVAHIDATDISEEMIRIARHKAALAGVSNVAFEVASIEAVDVADGSYDGVLGMSILHLVEDCDAAIAKAWRMLRPGGFFASSTVCLRERHWWLWPVLQGGRLIGRLPPVKFLRARDLEAKLTRAGFRIDHQWRPAPGKAVFMVAVKPE